MPQSASIFSLFPLLVHRCFPRHSSQDDETAMDLANQSEQAEASALIYEEAKNRYILSVHELADPMEIHAALCGPKSEWAGSRREGEVWCSPPSRHVAAKSRSDSDSESDLSATSAS